MKISWLTRRKSFEEINQNRKIRYEQILESLCLGNKTAKEITVDSLLNWEENFTNIYMSTVGDDPTIYVWRIFRRYEYLKTLGDSTSSATVDWDNGRQRQDFIIKSCLLFPNPSLYFRANSAAGVLPTLEKQILYKSGFIPDQEALSSINIIG